MKAKIFVFGCGLVLSASAFGSEFLKPFPTEVMPSEIISLEVLPAYHFEMKAPQKCDDTQPLFASPRKIQCQFKTAGEHQIRMSVCDNAKTFCRPTHVSVKVTGQKEQTHASDPSENLKKTQEYLHEKTLPGFLHLTPEQLPKEKKPVFVMVSTDWCPPCNEAKEALLATNDFQKATADWTRVYIDGDHVEEGRAWKPYMTFTYFPTFVLLNADLKEVARYNGAFRLYDFQAWADQARRNLNVPIADVEKTVRRRKKLEWGQWFQDLIHGSKKEADQDRLIAWAIAAENKDVLSLFTDADIPKDQKAGWFRLQTLLEPDMTEEKQLVMKLHVLEAGQESDNFTEDLQDLCSENVTACKPWVEKLNGRKAYWDSKKFANAAEKDVALIEDYANISNIFTAVGEKEKAQASAEECVQVADELTKNSPLKLSRAAGIGASYCLQQVGRFKDAEKIFQGLLKTYSSEPTFYIRYAKFMQKQNRLKEARAAVEKALPLAYGNNWLTAVLLKAKIEITMKDKSAAQKTIRSALAELDLSSPDPQSRDQRFAKAFRDLEQGLEAKN